MAFYATKAGKPEKQYLHAELDAIIRCNDLTKASKIFVYRVNNKGETLLAKPCSICESAIKAAGIKLTEWTT